MTGLLAGQHRPNPAGQPANGSISPRLAPANGPSAATDANIRDAERIPHEETRTKQNSRRHECATGSEDFSLPLQALQSSGVQKERRTSRSTQKLVTLAMPLLRRQSNRVVVRQNPTRLRCHHKVTVLHWFRILPTVFAAPGHNAVIDRRHRPSEEP